jgi:hypothetical protein
VLLLETTEGIGGLQVMSYPSFQVEESDATWLEAPSKYIRVMAIIQAIKLSHYIMILGLFVRCS